MTNDIMHSESDQLDRFRKSVLYTDPEPTFTINETHCRLYIYTKATDTLSGMSVYDELENVRNHKHSSLIDWPFSITASDISRMSEAVHVDQPITLPDVLLAITLRKHALGLSPAKAGSNIVYRIFMTEQPHVLVYADIHRSIDRCYTGVIYYIDEKFGISEYLKGGIFVWGLKGLSTCVTNHISQVH